MKNKITLILIVLIPFTAFSQELPFQTIPENPGSYSAGTVMARLVQGLGFRYYWVTDSLTEENLVYRPNEEARSIIETMEHIHELSIVIVNAVTNKPSVKTGDRYTYDELRALTLANLKKTSDILLTSSDENFETYSIVFQAGDQQSSFPFWNNINGPIADALWHVGQIVSFRRSAGNPFNSKVNVFTGRKR